MQRLDLRKRQVAELAHFQLPQPDRAEGDSGEFEDFVADAGEQPAEFAVVSFRQHHFQPGALPDLLERFDRPDAEPSFGESQPLFQRFVDFPRRMPRHLDVVRPENLVPGMSHPLRQVPVVRHDQKTGAVFIQPAHRE